MRIFLTGGSGYIGSAVLDALVRAGHRVDALVRSTEKAAQVHARGGHAVMGELGNSASYAQMASAADGVVHAAFDYGGRGPEMERAALDLFVKPVAGRQRFLIYTSGIWVLGPCPTPVDESAPLNPIEQVAWRAPHEALVLDAASDSLRTVVVRPGVVYGGSRGIVGDLLRDAANGLVRVIGNGDNHWPLVYERDLGELYLRIATTPEASGIYHANDEGDERVNDLVAAIGEHVKTRPSVRRVPLPEARSKMGAYAEALALDQIVRSPRARAIGWNPSLHSVAGNAARLVEEWRRGRDAA
jgi:nucleoside-diphosphate-sugar epimerase